MSKKAISQYLVAPGSTCLLLKKIKDFGKLTSNQLSTFYERQKFSKTLSARLETVPLLMNKNQFDQNFSLVSAYIHVVLRLSATMFGAN